MKLRRPLARRLESLRPGDPVQVFRMRLRTWVPATFVRFEGALAVVRIQGAQYVERVQAVPAWLRDARQGGLEL